MQKIKIGFWFLPKKALNILIVSCFCVALSGCFGEKPEISGHVVLKKVSFSELNDWNKENFSDVIKPFALNCNAVIKNTDKYIDKSSVTIDTAAYQKVCKQFQKENIGTSAQMKKFIEKEFEVFAVFDDDNDVGKFTSYYEAVVHASLKKHGKYVYPIYGRPRDLVEINLKDFDSSLPDKRLVGRVSDGKFVPYYNRRDIENNGIEAPVLMWGDDLVDIHLMQIQGSAVAKMDDGQEMRIGFADSNGLKFKGIGSILLEKKLIDAKDASMPKIREWLRNNPQKAAELMKENERFIFQKINTSGGPQGALGVSLTAGRSMAVDKQYIPLSAMMWLDTKDPDNVPLRKIVFAQDIGSAIKGVIRGDYFWGYGENAFQKAGRMNSAGKYYIVAPKNSVVTDK